MTARHLKKILILLTLPALALTLPGCEKDEYDAPLDNGNQSVLKIYRTTNSSRKRVPGKDEAAVVPEQVRFVYNKGCFLIEAETTDMHLSVEIFGTSSDSKLSLENVAVGQPVALPLAPGVYTVVCRPAPGTVYHGNIRILY